MIGVSEFQHKYVIFSGSYAYLIHLLSSVICRPFVNILHYQHMQITYL
jgi:hypothetical protein